MSETLPTEQGRQETEAEAEAEVISRYLPQGYTAAPEEELVSPDPASPDADTSVPNTPQNESSLKLQGGDIHRDLYKINAKPRHHRRAASYPYASLSDNNDGSADHYIPVSEQILPGGFRRQFMLQQSKNINSVTGPVTRSFVDFLALYGHFAGEDLENSDDESESASPDDNESQSASERDPLLARRKRSRRKRVTHGDASKTKTFFTTLKAFIGTGIMFLPKAFNNGGILFSSITLVTVAAITSLCFHLLLQCRKKHGGDGYGDLGALIGGQWLRILILSSITISQLGFVCSSLIFTAENLVSFIRAVSKDGSTPLSTNALIGLQLVLLVPLSYIRNMSKLGPSAILADMFIFFGLIYIYYYDVSFLAKNSINPTVELFNPLHYTLTVGSSIFTFEGIGLILPIQSSMKEPEKFHRLLFVVMAIITMVFLAVGALSYATFGEDTLTEVISNFPQESPLVNIVQFLYALAVLVGAPVQLFPAVRIIEGKIFHRKASGKQSKAIKWQKNGFRSALVLLIGVISALGANDLDKFVALIGSFACVPLVYIYPAFLHYKTMASSRRVALGDILLMILGFVGMVYTTCITLMRWIQE